MGLLFSKNNHMQVKAYTNVDYARYSQQDGFHGTAPL